MADNKPTVHSFGLGTSGGKFSSGYGASYGTVSTSMGTAPKPSPTPAAPATPDAIAQLFERAMNAHKAGRLNEAATGYQQVLAADANHADANHLFGMLYYQQGQCDKALAFLQRAIAQCQSADYLGHLGAVYMALNRQAEAEQAYRQALAVKPDNPGANYNLGVLCQGQQRWGDAEKAYRAELALDGNDADSLYNLVGVLMAQGKAQQAEAFASKLVALAPQDWRGHACLGQAKARLGQFRDAETALQRAIALDARQASPHLFLGCLYWDEQRWDEAAQALSAAAQKNPTAPDALVNLAAMYVENGNFDAAQPLLDQALARAPQHVDAHVIATNLRLSKGLFAEAENWAERSLGLMQQAGGAMGGTADSQLNLSLALLTFGRLQQGWPLHESRYAPGRQSRNAGGVPVFPFALPMWQGEPLQGKTILLMPEQGHGDQIQFVRYTQQLKALGATVWLMTKPPLARLLAGAPAVDRLLSENTVLAPGQVDFWAFPLSLPYHLGTTLDSIPAAPAYLAADAEKAAFWRNWLDQATAPASRRVGLVWAGNPKHTNDKNRSIDFAKLAPLFEVPGVSWVSLQLGERANDAAALFASGKLLDPSALIHDFSDSAALLDQLDLLITVDSAPAHLAGALGKPVWNLLPLVPDWRWLLQRDDSPWYPGMRLFRQRELQNWEGVVANVAQSLQQWLAR